MKMKFTAHAIERMRSRGITKREAKEAILNGQTWRMQAEGTIRRAYRKDKRILVIIYKQAEDYFKVITAFYEN